MRQNYFFGGISKGILGSIKKKIPKPRSFGKDDDGPKIGPRPITNFGGPRPRPIQPGPSVDPSGPRPIQPGPAVDPSGPRPLGPKPIGPITPQIDPNRDYGFNKYGFDTDLLNYLNRQKQASFIDAGIGYNYDPKTKTFSGGSMVNQYKNIPLSVLQQVATSGDRNLLNQYITGGRGFNQPPMQQPIPRDYGSGNQLPPGSTGFPKQPQQPIPRDYGYGNQLPPGLMGQTGMVGAQPQLINPVRPGVQQQAPLQQQAFSYGGRAGYEMGGLGSLQTNFGQSLQVPQQPNFGQPMFNFTGNSIASNPLLNYGQTPLTMADGGTTRSNYQEGGSTDFYNNQEPIFPRIENIGSLLDQAEQSIGQSKDNFNSPLATTFSRFGMQEGGMSMDQIMQPQMQDQAMMQGAGNDEQGQTAILTIIQLLIEQGIDPETAKELAGKILEAFSEGGAPAVEAFANQLEQEEVQMMAGGGIAGYAQRQGYGFGSFVSSVFKGVSSAVKGVAKAVKSVVQSPIGQIALAIAAPYAIGAMFPAFATLGGTGFLGAALRSGISNLAIQGITTGKIDPKQALIAGIGGGAVSSLSSNLFGGTNPDIGGIPDAMQPQPSVTSNLANAFSPPNIQPNIPTNTGYTGFESGVESMIAPKTSYAYAPDISKISMDPAAAPNTSLVMNAKQPSFFENITNQAQQFGTNLMKDPLKTIGTGIQSLYDKTNLKDIGTGFLLAQAIRPQGVNESDEDYQEYLKNHNAEVKKYYDLYSGSLNPPLVLAATGGRIGYEYGSIPMGEPRRNPAGIMEIDYRKKGGFVPPIGIKEKADDIPAMLSNNEFVFTANAVRNAGGGDVNKGAERMYSLMKNLEAGGRV